MKVMSRVLLGIGGICCVGSLFAVTDLPAVRAVYPTDTGGNVICTGSACEGIVMEWRAASSGWIDYEDSQRPDEEIPIKKAHFCANLKASRPANCNYSSPPPVPGFTPNWQPNGCGTGQYGRMFAEQGLSVSFGSEFTGNLDVPYRTRSGQAVSFLGACNAHDRCWGEGNDRTWCDLSFRDNMIRACSVEADTAGYGTCMGMASAYHAGVSSSYATAHYNQTLANRECTAWVHDMRANNCPP